MRRIACSWSVAVAAAVIGWLAVAWADPPQPPPSSPPARELSPLEKAMAAQPPETPHNKKPAKKSAAPRGMTSPPYVTARPMPPGTRTYHDRNQPVAFTSEEGIKGWSIVIPGNQPLATPAVADGKVFVGGGYSSHDFGALYAKTGKVLWHYFAADNGPTAPVVANNYVTFNTESCDLEVLTTDGRPVWKKTLGSSLMTMPAVADGRIVVSFPSVVPNVANGILPGGV